MQAKTPSGGADSTASLPITLCPAEDWFESLGGRKIGVLQV
jgi:hypothetical protein